MYRVLLTCPAKSIYCTVDEGKEKKLPQMRSWCNTGGEKWSLRPMSMHDFDSHGKEIVNVNCKL